MQAPIPILRSFSEAEAKAFYVDYLGFTVTFEHRFDAAAPLYFEVLRGNCRLHISEHHGDAAPGQALRIGIDDADAFHAEIIARAQTPQPRRQRGPVGLSRGKRHRPVLQPPDFLPTDLALKPL